ncbi:MAG: NADH:flavin oxidoreductase/NADH oxidase [Bifidobacteriaceae bacterium]|nr:NADH:flavin oxidoreductase/NADH oxidase [Bifidobacteriaceae bacterium]
MSKHHEQELVDEVSGAPKSVTVDEPSGVESVEALAEDAARKAKKARKAEREELKAERKAAKKAAKKAKKTKEPKEKADDDDVVETLPEGEFPRLFEPMTLRSVTFRNRIWMPPMDTYSVFAQDGKPTPFHYQHYVSRAMGGFGLVICESTAVAPEGRISPNDVGLWEDSQIDAWRWIVEDVKKTGAVAGVQLNHGGRKASTGSFSLGYINQTVPADQGGWQPLAPSPIPYGKCTIPTEMTTDQIHAVVDQFRAAAQRAIWAGFQVIEIHAAHGYLLSEFLDSLSNHRTDEYGGSFENRIRLLVEVVDAVRGVMPAELPLFVRVSATDWSVEKGSWDLKQTVALARVLKEHGVDLVDVSTGGIISGVTIPAAPNYQVPFSDTVHHQAGVPTTAVGLITEPKQAEKIVRADQASAVEIGRAALRDPYWPLRAAAKLGLDKKDAPYQPQYVRGAYGTAR